MAENPLKRPYPTDDLQNGDSNGDGAQKKIRSSDRSPAPQANGATGAKPDVSKIMADARARAAAVAAKLRGTGSPTSSTPDPAISAKPSGISRADELKARVALAMGKNAQRTVSTPSPAFSPPPLDDSMGARGGLGTALHPALMDNGQGAGSSKSKQAIQSKFPTTMANLSSPSPANQSKPGKAKKQLDLSGPSAEETRANPYFDASLGAKTATLKSRNARQLQFNPKGKYIQQAASLRRAANLEAMRKRIQESSKKALPSEDPGEKNFLIEAPPEIEWWDEGLVTDAKKGYGAVDKENKIETEDTIVSRFIQYPVHIEPPGEALKPTPKPLFLTTREQKKLRRQTRMETLKEQQTKERLGLLPTPAPKIKLKNMMRVVGEEAVKDPTAVEAMVRKQVADREQTHLQMNEDRKLTKEERHEKLEEKKAKDEAKGIYLLVFKIDSLANGKHRFKISKNCEQWGGRGLMLCHPKQSLVLTEFGEHGMKKYKKTMDRVAWQENDSPNNVKDGNKKALAAWLENTEDGVLKDLSANRCQLIFEGQQKGHQFRSERFTTKAVETDKEAVDYLERSKLGSMWALAKSVA